MSDGVPQPNIDALMALQPLSRTGDRRRPTDGTMATWTRSQASGTEDDGSAVLQTARRLRSGALALAGANAALRQVQARLHIARVALRCGQDVLVTMRTCLVALAESDDDTVTDQTRTAFSTDLARLQAWLTLAFTNAGSSATGRHPLTEPAAMMAETLGALVHDRLGGAALLAAPVLAAFLAQGGGFNDVTRTMDERINAVEADMDNVTNHIAYNEAELAALSTGLGPLVDANLEAEAARLKALHLAQLLKAQQVSLGQGTPSMLVALFK